jgi:hypothetical protein
MNYTVLIVKYKMLTALTAMCGTQTTVKQNGVSLPDPQAAIKR